MNNESGEEEKIARTMLSLVIRCVNECLEGSAYVIGEASVHRAGLDGHDLNAVRDTLNGEVGGELSEAGLAGAVESVGRGGEEGSLGRGEDDAAFEVIAHHAGNKETKLPGRNRTS